jgi:hypothetical protein
MNPEPPSSIEGLLRLKMTLREAGERLLDLQEQLIALRYAMQPHDDAAVQEETTSCIEKAHRR